MKLSVSNIAWDAANDNSMYLYLQEQGFSGIEIAPTRIFPESPYQQLREAEKFSKNLLDEYNLTICSVQSIWYGRQERLFGTEAERKILLEYTKAAINFANAIHCNNLVFGCPRNRVIEDSTQYEVAVHFFQTVGDYAKEKGTVVSIEPNPTIYHTNFINTTPEALRFCQDVNSEGVAVNLDCGTMLENGESVDCFRTSIQHIHHVHISEPDLVKIEKRNIHKLLRDSLISGRYNNYVSIEMKKYNDSTVLKDVMRQVAEVFLA